MRKNIRLIFIFFLILKNLAYADILKEYWENAPSLKEYPGVSAIVLLDEITCEVEKDGTKTIIEHEIIKLCDNEGIERFAKIYYYYLKNFQEVNLERAAVINEDGEEYVLKGGLIKDETPLPKSPLFSNIKFKTIILPQVKIGSIIEYKIKIKENFPQIYKNFWTASFLSDFIPILDSRFILKVPKEINFNYKIIGEEKISPEKISQGDYFYYKWKFNNSSKIPKEIAQLPSGALSSKIFVSTIPSWDYLASWCYKLFKESAYSDKAVKKLTLDLTKDKKSLKDKVKSLYDYIRKEIKYIDLPWGDLGYKLHSPSIILKQKNGNSADLSSLLYSMLKELKVEAYPVLINNLTRGEIIPELPAPWYFDHILIMALVEGEKIFLDPVSEFIPFGELTPQMQNRSALLILKNKGKLIKTPDTLAYQNQEEIIIEGKLTENGDLNQTVEVREYGNNALIFKELFSLFKNKEQIYFIFSKLASYFFGNAELYETYISDIEEINFPFRFNFHFYTKNYAQNAADLYYFRLPIFSSFKMFSLVRQHPLERLTPLVLGSNGQIDKRIHLILPKGFKIKALPSVTYLKNSAGTFQLTYYQEGQDLWYYSRLIINPSIVPPSQYKDLKSLIETSYQLEDEIVLLEKDQN